MPQTISPDRPLHDVLALKPVHDVLALITYSSRELYELICKGLGRAIPGWNVPVPVLRGLARAGDAIGRLRGRRFFFDSDALEKLIGSAWYNSEKISRDLGYRPVVTFEEALPELILWYRKGQG